jgi:hypothetical protein
LLLGIIPSATVLPNRLLAVVPEKNNKKTGTQAALFLFLASFI